LTYDKIEVNMQQEGRPLQIKELMWEKDSDLLSETALCEF
jgi:hypothetical protein